MTLSGPGTNLLTLASLLFLINEPWLTYATALPGTMSRYELRHEHAERTTRLLYCLMRDEKFDVIFAMQKINNGYEATAKRFYPIKPKRIGAQAFCMEALRLTSKENLTGMLNPRAGPSPFRCPYANYIARAVDTSAKGKQWSEGLNPDGYSVVSDELEKDPSQYYK